VGKPIQSRNVYYLICNQCGYRERSRRNRKNIQDRGDGNPCRVMGCGGRLHLVKETVPIQPLRRVLGETVEIVTVSETFSYSRPLEVLECGHTQQVKTDLYGEYRTSRRRCAKCAHGQPMDYIY
jgi:hypothetical protein